MESSNIHTIFVCKTCRKDDALLHAVQKAFSTHLAVTVQETRCMGGCSHMEKGCGYNSIAFCAAGKDSVLLHKLTPSDDDMALLKDFFHHYERHPEGRIRIKQMSHPRANITYFMARLPALFPIDKNQAEQ